MAEGKYKAPRTKKAAAARAATSASPGPTGTAGLQRSAGNGAMAQMIARLRSSEGSTRDGPAARGNPTFERQADEVAARAGGQPVTADRRPELSGAPLAPEHAAGLQALTGKDVSRVRLHTDQAAQAAAENLDAHAFTSGTDIHFGPGTYDPGSSKGFELLAHEVTHAVEHPSGHDHAGNELVHAKLKGTRGALEDLGGKAKKSLLKSVKGSRWNELLSQLAKYERYEDEYAALLGDPTAKGYDKAEAKLRAKLLKALLSLEKVGLQWQAANDQEGADAIEAESDSDRKGDHEEDARTKGHRRQAVALFLTRVRVEKIDVERGQFGSGGSTTPSSTGARTTRSVAA